MKTKIEYDLDANRYRVYYKECGFFGFWRYEKSFENLEDAEKFAVELSKHPKFIAVYKDGARIK